MLHERRNVSEAIQACSGTALEDTALYYARKYGLSKDETVSRYFSYLSRLNSAAWHHSSDAVVGKIMEDILTNAPLKNTGRDSAEPKTRAIAWAEQHMETRHLKGLYRFTDDSYQGIRLRTLDALIHYDQAGVSGAHALIVQVNANTWDMKVRTKAKEYLGEE